MNYSDEVLMAYVDGELDGKLRIELDQAIATEPELAARVRAYEALRGQVRAGFEPILEEVVPDRLLRAVRSPSGHRPGVSAVPTHRKPVALHAWSQWGALAAGLILGAIIWRFSDEWSTSNWITQRGGRLTATGSLARALTEQLASEQSSTDSVQIGITIRSKAGAYCRTFTVRDASAVAGLACREGKDWTLQVLARTEAPQTQTGRYRQAASGVPDVVLQAAQAISRGEPLDAQAETAAKSRQWQAP
jgi:hypothetical protein